MDTTITSTKLWQRKRKWMFLNFCVGAYAFGLSINGYYPTEYYYLKDTVGVANPELYFGLSSSMLYLSGAVSSIVGSCYVDYSKNVRLICLTEDLLNIIGNVMYSLYYSPYLILFGQLLIGTTSARMTASIGELSCVYVTGEITRKLSILGIFSTLGAFTGPCTTFLFQYVDISIRNWKLNIGNMIGIVMALFYLLQFILNFITLSNVSKEYTLKEGSTSSSEEELLLSNGTRISFHEKYLSTLKVFFQHKHIVFWLSTCFITTFSRIIIRIAIPIKAEQYLHWKQKEIAVIWLISICSTGIPTAVLFSLLTKHVNDFYLFLSSLMTLLLSLIFMGQLPIFSSSTTKTILIGISSILFFSSSSAFHILSRSMLAKFVPENIQSISEGFRNAIFEVAAAVAGLFVILPTYYLSQTMFALAICISAAMSWYLAENDKFRNIKIISVD